MSIDSIIESLGGTSRVAEALGVSPSRVSNWRSRGRIPPGRWEALEAAALQLGVNGITAKALAGLHAERASGVRG